MNLNVIPNIIDRKPRFDSKGNLIKKPRIIQENSHDISKRNVVDVCKLLIVPMRKVGKLVRSAGEAKLLVECSLLAHKIMCIWPMLTLTLVTYQMNEKTGHGDDEQLTKSMHSLLISSPHLAPLHCLLQTVSFEQWNIIQRLCVKFSKCLQKLLVVRNSLVRNADLHAAIASELNAVLQHCSPLAKDKKKLSDIELCLANRIDWLVKGCPQNFNLDLRSWDTILGECTQENPPTSVRQPSLQEIDEKKRQREDPPSVNEHVSKKLKLSKSKDNDQDCSPIVTSPTINIL